MPNHMVEAMGVSIKVLALEDLDSILRVCSYLSTQDQIECFFGIRGLVD